MFQPWVLITNYTTASTWQCKCGRFSLPLYSKQERPLFTAALEQTSNVPTARDVGRSSGRVRRRASGLPYPASGRRSRLPPSLPSVVFPARISTHAPRRAPETRPLPAVKRAHPPGARDDNQFLSHESACLAHKRSSNLIRIFTNEGRI